MDLFSIAVGAAGVGAAYFIYLVATKGLPAALAWVKAKWTAGKAEVAALQGDVADVQTKLASFETVALTEIKSRLSAVEAQLGSLKPPSAPAFLAAAGDAPKNGAAG